MLFVAPTVQAANFTASDASSLIAAINNANDEVANPGSDTITLTADIELTAILVNTVGLGPTALPYITSSVVIEGHGFAIQRGDGTWGCSAATAPARSFRPLAVTASGSLSINNTTVAYGCSAAGGGFSQYGGGILNRGNLTLNNSIIASNMALSTGGGILHYSGVLSVNNTTFSDNLGSSPASGGGGGAIYSSSLITNITNSRFNNNSGWTGGAILNYSTISSITNTTFTANSSQPAWGGAISNSYPGTINIANSTFSANTSTSGGAIANTDGGLMSIVNSTFNSNTAPSGDGGAIFNGYGGSFLGVRTPEMTITNSTLSGNSAQNSGGAIYNGDGSYLTLTNNTLNGNSAAVGGGLYHSDYDFAGGTAIINTIIANSLSGGDCVATTAAAIPVIINSLIETNTDCVGTYSSDPNLAPLADNGGATLTHAILSPSAAIDTGNAAYCPATDQRGAPRVGLCDIGAFVIDAVPPTITFTIDNPTLYESNTPNQATVSVTVSDLPVGSTLQLNFVLAGSADDNDYDTTYAGTLTFTTNSTQTFTISSLSDTLTEGAETVTLQLLVVGAAGITGPNSQTVTIQDDPLSTPTPMVTPDTDNREPGIAATGTAVAEVTIFDPAISKTGFLVPGQVGVTGEEIEWVITIINNGTAAGNNVQITDVIDNRLKVNRVETPVGQAAITNQTVVVTIPTIAAGQTVQFSIFTTVVQGVSIENTACLTANNTTEHCATGLAIYQLPSTGESPWWRIPLLLSMSGIALLAGVRRFSTMRRKRTA